MTLKKIMRGLWLAASFGLMAFNSPLASAQQQSM
jgi:hypothetical protein